MNTEKFTGKAQDYVEARPSYPDEAIEYIYKLAPPKAVFADIGAGTGKLTELLARYGNEIFAVEPNIDMREHLTSVCKLLMNIEIIEGTAENTTLSDHSIDVILCAQALGWFNLDAFKNECYRIGKPGAIVISIYNKMPGDNSIPANNRLTTPRATEMFFKNPVIREFPNPVFYTKERWLQYNVSVSDSPQPSDVGYNAHINEIFDHENEKGLIRKEIVTSIYSERLD